MRGTDRQREPDRDRPEPGWHRWMLPACVAVLAITAIGVILNAAGVL